MVASEDRLWKVFWLWGIPVAGSASALVLGAEAAREAGWHNTGNVADVARLAVYWFWMRAAWRCSRNVARPLWTPLTRFAMAGGLALTVLT